MADVELVRLTRIELLVRRTQLDEHIADCCGTQDGTCQQLEQLGEIQFLLGDDHCGTGYGERPPTPNAAGSPSSGSDT